MNSANEISHHTKLYGFIGEYAGQSSISATLNKLFKANNKNAMMIPMNIREDDFFFTLSNMKRSHVNGALISSEYMKSVVELLDESSQVVKNSLICDIVIRDQEKLFGDIVGMRVLVDFLKNSGCKKVALVGIGSRAKAFCHFAKDLTIAYFYDNLEDLMSFTKEIDVSDPDINRLAEGMVTDLSSYDAVVDFSTLSSLGMIGVLGGINLDMKSKKEISPLRVRSNEIGARYIGFDDMLSELADGVYQFLKDKKDLEDDKSDMKF